MDGPVSPFDAERGMAGPNLDLLINSDLEKKTIAIDRRHLTVILLAKKLAKTHWLSPTESFLQDTARLGIDINSLAGLTQINERTSKLHRTCVFYPKS